MNTTTTANIDIAQGSIICEDSIIPNRQDYSCFFAVIIGSGYGSIYIHLNRIVFSSNSNTNYTITSTFIITDNYYAVYLIYPISFYIKNYI